MNERIAFGKCPLCECPTLLDSAVGDCSKHPLYHSSLSPIIRWKQCAGCSHVFAEGYYTDAVCKLIFSKTNESQKVGFELEKQRITSSHIVEKILPHIAEGYWLDVGFGNGSLLFTAHEYGFHPVGLDLREDTVKLMVALGIEAYCEDVTRFSYKSGFSVISMADVLEHMPYPKNGLQAAHRLLADGGVLFISMPNLDSLLWKALTINKVNPYWGELEHYHNFGRNRLYGLLREFGFEPVRYGISERYRACMEIIARKVTA